MIRIDHLALPPGLDAIARRTGRGELYVVISDSLDPGRQRAAMRAAVRAARRHAWEFGMLPLPLAAAAPALRGAARQVLHFLRAHGAVSAVAGSLAAGSVAATAAVFIVAVPHDHPAALAPDAPGYTQSGGHRHHPAAGTRPGTPARGQHGGTGGRVITVVTPKTSKPRPEPNPTTRSTSPPVKTSPPTTSTGTTSPSPAPTATSTSPSSGGKGTCVIILGVEVCL